MAAMQPTLPTWQGVSTTSLGLIEAISRTHRRLLFFLGVITILLVNIAAVDNAIPMIGVPTEAQDGEAKKDPMAELLYWAVKHSDPAKLKELKQKYQENNLTIRDVYGGDFLDNIIDDSAVMKDAIKLIADFRNESMSDDVLVGALEQLQEFVEQIDNAGNLHRMGGLAPLLDLAESSARENDIRTLALWTIGIAVQNNPPVQNDLLGLDGLRRLVARLHYCHGDIRTANSATEKAFEEAPYCAKLLFALSGLIKNNQTIQTAANTFGVFEWLFDEGIQHTSLPVAKKSLGLLDTVLSQNADSMFLDNFRARRDAVAEAIFKHIRGVVTDETDMDAAEKALRLVNRLLSLRPFLFAPGFREELASAGRVATDHCKGALGLDDELCDGITGLAQHADLMLAAGDIPDEEL